MLYRITLPPALVLFGGLTSLLHLLFYIGIHLVLGHLSYNVQSYNALYKYNLTTRYKCNFAILCPCSLLQHKAPKQY